MGVVARRNVYHSGQDNGAALVTATLWSFRYYHWSSSKSAWRKRRRRPTPPPGREPRPPPGGRRACLFRDAPSWPTRPSSTNSLHAPSCLRQRTSGLSSPPVHKLEYARRTRNHKVILPKTVTT